MESFRPRITAGVPDGWYVKESITLLQPNGEANIIASAEPLDPTLTSEVYATTQGDVLRDEFPGYREISFGTTDLFGGQSGFVRKFEWTPPDGEQVTQIQIYYVESGRGYTATATTPTISLHKFESVLLDTLRALTLAAR
jgi:hypothetical protein